MAPSSFSRTISFLAALTATMPASYAADAGLWPVYNDFLRTAKYIDMTHTIGPRIPVWAGFGPQTFMPAKADLDVEGFATKGQIFTYEKNGFEANSYLLSTDQLGTQLDPPAHWAPEYPSIDELPAPTTRQSYW